MQSYVIVQINVTNQTNYEEYKNKVTPIVEKYGGKYLVRGGKSENIEGVWPYQRTVVLKFPTYDMAKKWYDSEDYKPVKKIRLNNSKCNAIIIEGL